jgi:hypothetical protein
VTEHPLVHVVVLDHDGGELTLACLRSLLASDWPPDRLRVVLVDNASRAPVTVQVAAELPSVYVRTSSTNLGFAGGVNLGLRERGDADFVALLNNDATVEPGWLAPLVATIAADPRVGAACPKILLASPAVEIALSVPMVTHRRGDRRALGIRVSDARVGTSDRWDRTQLVDGFWGYEPMPTGERGGQWTRERALLRVPVTRDDPVPPPVALRCTADHDVVVTAASGARTTALTVGRTPGWHDIAIGADPVDVINNVGTVVDDDGYGSDRGWLEVDRGQYDEPADVAAWCGGAVLLARAYLDDVGLLDERLFLYYEDVDLSLRGAQRGWRYHTAPDSVVRHRHSATSVEGSPLAFHYNERNRLLVSLRDAPIGIVARTFARYGAVTASYAMRDITAPVLQGERPRPEIVARRLRAVGAAAMRLPAMRRRPSSATPSTPR